MSRTTLDTSEIPLLSTRKQLAEMFGVSERHWDNMVARGLAPTPIYIGERTPRWTRSSVIEFLDAGGTSAPSSTLDA